MPWQWPVGALCAFLVALVATPAGVSGAVFLLPVQVSVLRISNLTVSPTNLLFNIIATPGGLLRFWRRRHESEALMRLLIAGTLPGVIGGAILRVELLSSESAFVFVAAGVLFPVGAWLLIGRRASVREPPELTPRVKLAISSVAWIVGLAGGIYGIGGGSLLAPFLMVLGFSAGEVAPATLAATFVTSLAGLGAYEVLNFVVHHGDDDATWVLGAWLGAGGFIGSYLGAHLHGRLSERTIRHLLGGLACLVAAHYVVQGFASNARW